MIEPYPDGRWWPVDHRVHPRFPIVGRGNVGEVYPNVVTPMCGSLLTRPMSRGTQRAMIDLGMATADQIAAFDGDQHSVTPCLAGYLYGSVSLARTLAVRTPGISPELLDEQMFGIIDAPPYVRGPGDRDLRAALRGAWSMGGAFVRPSDRSLIDDRAAVAEFVGRVERPYAGATVGELWDVVTAGPPLWQRLMANLIASAAPAAIGRSVLERLVEPAQVNDLTAGLGTIESAQPALELCRLARLDGPAFDAGFAEFVERHGARGPDEWELASPTWGTDPSIALAAVDRLRGAPADRDPVEIAASLEARRERAVAAARSSVPFGRRRMFDMALRAVAIGEANREGTKAAYVRALYPARRALAELARRSAFTHDDFFLLMPDEGRRALDDPAPFEAVVAERRARRDYLQARVPPFWFEGEIPPPSAWELRADGRHPDPTPRTMWGMGVCGGSATGTARIVTDPAAPGGLGPGDVLIAPHTDPAWTPLFLAVAGVVVDVGAQLSHAAIVARELGVPAVVGVAGASATIPDGALVTVDGDAGTVVVHGG